MAQYPGGTFITGGRGGGGGSSLPSLIFFGILGESVKLGKCHFGPFSDRNGKKYMFSL